MAGIDPQRHEQTSEWRDGGERQDGEQEASASGNSAVEDMAPSVRAQQPTHKRAAVEDTDQGVEWRRSFEQDHPGLRPLWPSQHVRTGDRHTDE